jgi:cytochrome c oxidase subunit 2
VRLLRSRGALAALVVLAACGGPVDQSVLHPAGPRAERVASLWWFAFSTATVVYVATVGALLWALWRARRRARRGEALPPGGHRGMHRAVTVATGVTVAILLVFFGYDLSVGRTLRPPHERPHLLVKVTGYQWWWQVEYPDSVPARWVTDANEIHMPANVPVLVELTSNDVIHSLWIPNLGGKKDLIPRYKDTVWFQASRPGVYRSQCAEFCGHQHAKMALQVVVHDSADFARWLDASRHPAQPPTDSATMRGQEVFLSGPCAMCHAINGTPAGSRGGPELTHLASRRTIAAGTLENTKGNLAAWILDPQRIKPGANMPPNALTPEDLDALLAYLRSLK